MSTILSQSRLLCVPAFAGLALSAFADTLTVPGDHPTIQAAIDAATDGDEVVVSPGTWVENLDMSGKDLIVRSSGGHTVTTLQAPGGLGALYNKGEPATARFEGFTVTGGNGVTGGGIWVSGPGSDPTIQDCLFTGNTNQSAGGGIRITNFAEPLIQRCTFTQNSSERGAGVGATGNGLPLVVDCVFYKNQALGVIAEGGAFFFGTQSSGTMINCLIYDNTARIGGAGKNRSNSNTLFVNCTMAFNRAHHYTGGIWNSDTFPTMVNCILWGNIDPQMPGFATDIHDSNSLTTVSHSIIEEGFAGVGVTSTDPRFADPTTFDLRLANGSPAIDAGDSTALPVGMALDLAGLARLVDDPYTVDTGVGTAPVVDLGALEFQDPCGPDGGPVTYCPAKLNSGNCIPFMTWSGSVSAAASNLTLEAHDVLNQRNGLFFYGLTGRANIPFEEGTLCVFPPLRRTTIQNSGGTAPPTSDCSGVLTYDFAALIDSGSDPALVPGTVVNGQFWYRDPGVFTGVGLTNGVEWRICP